MKAKKIRTRLLSIVLWLLSLLVLVPMLLIVVNSFKTPAETNVLNLSLPKQWQFSNLTEIFASSGILRSFANSILVTFASIGCSVFFGTIAGYVLSRNRDSLNKKIYAFFIVGMIVPVQIIALVEVMQKLHLLDNYFGLTMVYTAMFIPQSIFMVYRFMSSVPKDMDEAAIVDGTNPWQLFTRIMIPLLKPILVTLFITQFVFVWNDFQMPLYLIKSSDNWTIVLGIFNYIGQYNSQWNMVCAYILVCTIPTVIIYLLGQKYIVEGMVAGAVKG